MIVDAGLNLPLLIGDLFGAVFEAVLHDRLLLSGMTGKSMERPGVPAHYGGAVGGDGDA